MRIFLLSFLLLVTEPLVAFNVGPTARSNFGAADKTQEEAQEQAPQTPYSATKYDLNRWRKENDTPVEPRNVDTAAAVGVAVPALPQPAVKENPIVAAPLPATLPVTMKKAVPEMTVKSFGKQTSTDKPETTATPKNASQPVAQEPAIPAEATAAMAQLGQMQDMMKSLGGGAGMSGMPDLSALMGGATGAQPAKK